MKKVINGIEFDIKPYANLHNVNLRNAILYNADLYNADLYNADLRNTDLRDANLRNANLRNADLRDAILYNADLYDADLRNADLRNANLYNANLYNADLRNADLSGAKLSFYKIAPPSGQFIAWKKCINETIVKLRIPWFARRCSSLVGRKIRVELAIVENIYTKDGKSIDYTANHTYSQNRTEYIKGEFVSPDSYDPDPRIECTHGIHCFLTKEEAEAW